MPLCLATTIGVATVALAGNSFTLAWVHSIERVRWEETWRVEGGDLVLDTVRIRGIGAGMEPPPEAVFRNGVWTWHPGTRKDVLKLTRSPYVADYEWCEPSRGCRPMSIILSSDGGVTEVRVCAAGHSGAMD
ncbi:MAG TPA: DUF1850 domain-containing protein [Nitrospira sp.]|nr:DUF1850 domain-containing protein [Nitrospira sp.]